MYPERKIQNEPTRRNLRIDKITSSLLLLLSSKNFTKTKYFELISHENIVVFTSNGMHFNS